MSTNLLGQLKLRRDKFRGLFRFESGVMGKDSIRLLSKRFRGTLLNKYENFGKLLISPKNLKTECQRFWSEENIPCYGGE